MNLRIKKDEDFRCATSFRFLKLAPLATLETPTDDGYRSLRLCRAALQPPRPRASSKLGFAEEEEEAKRQTLIAEGKSWEVTTVQE